MDDVTDYQFEYDDTSCYDDRGRWLCEQCSQRLRRLRRRATKMWVAYSNATLHDTTAYQVKVSVISI